jgi:hypothetical protein
MWRNQNHHFPSWEVEAVGNLLLQSLLSSLAVVSFLFVQTKHQKLGVLTSDIVFLQASALWLVPRQSRFMMGIHRRRTVPVFLS